MEQVKDKHKTTTVCVDTTVRDFIAAEAERQGLSLRLMLYHVTEAYKQQLEDSPAMKKGNDRIIAYMRRQEENYLAPILNAVQLMDSRLKVLIEVLKEVD
jgi:hypothetical protein